MKTECLRAICNPTLLAALFAVAEHGNNPSVCQENGVYTRLEYRSAMEKKEILPFAATQMDLEGLGLSEISQMEKDKYCMVITYVWTLKPNKQKTNLTESSPC